MKSNISVHQQEYENMLQLGENLLSTCDSDKDVVKKKLDNMKKKWKGLSDSKFVLLFLCENPFLFNYMFSIIFSIILF